MKFNIKKYTFCNVRSEIKSHMHLYCRKKNFVVHFLKNYKSVIFIEIAIIFMFFSKVAIADGGLERVNGFMENILTILRGASMAVVTVAIMWSGYKFLFKQADIAECGKILAGGLLIGGSTELAHHLLGNI